MMRSSAPKHTAMHIDSIILRLRDAVVATSQEIERLCDELKIPLAPCGGGVRIKRGHIDEFRLRYTIPRTEALRDPPYVFLSPLVALMRDRELYGEVDFEPNEGDAHITFSFKFNV